MLLFQPTSTDSLAKSTITFHVSGTIARNMGETSQALNVGSK